MITYLEDARKLAGLTQQQLADAAGVNRMTVHNIEGGRQPKPETAAALVEAIITLTDGPALLDPELLHRGRIRSSPEAIRSFFLIGQLLDYLPLREPRDKFWSVLDDGLGAGASAMTLRRQLASLHDRLFVDDTASDPMPWIAELTTPILTYLPPTDALADAMLGGGHFRNCHIAARWLDSLATATWDLWLYTNPDALPR
jgi:transcriptional regulator with XRE-family HTH domain